MPKSGLLWGQFFSFIILLILEKFCEFVLDKNKNNLVSNKIREYAMIFFRGVGGISDKVNEMHSVSDKTYGVSNILKGV